MSDVTITGELLMSEPLSRVLADSLIIFANGNSHTVSEILMVVKGLVSHLHDCHTLNTAALEDLDRLIVAIASGMWEEVEGRLEAARAAEE